MKTTVRGVILNLTSEQQSYLDNLMDRYCAAIRWAFKRLQDNQQIQSIRKAVQLKFNLNSRQANDAVYEAQSLISSQRELVKLNYETARQKVKFTTERIKKAKSPKKIAGLTKRLDKEQRRLARWQKHIDNNTYPTVVFGGKKLFHWRCKGLISRAAWLDARSNRYLSRGDQTKGGNLNTRIYTDNNNMIYLDIASDQVATKKSIRYKRITVPIYLACKSSKKTGSINGRNYRQMVLDHLKTGGTYQVEIIRKSSRYYVHVTIEEKVPVPYLARNGVIGVDTNPGGLGIAKADYLGQYKASMWLAQGEWTYARSNKRANLIGETAAQVVRMAKITGCALVVEDLKFKNDKDVSAKFNRMSHGFIWSKSLAYTQRRALREGVPLIKAKPAFTSIIGILKYQQQHGISSHESAGYVIARRGLGINFEQVPKALVDKFISKKDGFGKLSNWKQWSSIKKVVIKNLKKKEVNSLVSWQHYRKQLIAG